MIAEWGIRIDVSWTVRQSDDGRRDGVTQMKPREGEIEIETIESESKERGRERGRERAPQDPQTFEGQATQSGHCQRLRGGN